MKVFVSLLIIIFALPSWAFQEKKKNSVKEELKTLYKDINASDDPHNDDHIRSEVTRLVRKSCLKGAEVALKRRNLSATKRMQMTSILTSACGCVAESSDVKQGVIDSALLLKKHGKNSKAAKHAMTSAMRKAQADCMQQAMKQMKGLR